MNSRPSSPAPATNTASQVHLTVQEPQKSGLHRSPAIASNRVPKSRRPPTLPVKPAMGLVRGGVAGKARKEAMMNRQPIRNLAGQAGATAATAAPISVPNASARGETLISKQPTRNLALPASAKPVIASLKPVGALAKPLNASAKPVSVSAKPMSIPTQADKWRAKYEEQFAEAEQMRHELQKVLADNETQRKEISQLKNSEDRVSAEMACYRDEFSKVEAQAKLAGKLQTDLNIAHHTVIPPLREQNELLKQELNNLRKNSNVVESTREPEGLHKEPKMRSSTNDRAKLSDKVNAEQKAYIETLENINETLNKKYLKLVTEVSNQKTRCAILEGQKMNLESEAEKYQNRIMQLTNDVTELEAEKEGIESEIRSIANEASDVQNRETRCARCASLEGQNSGLLAEAEDHQNRIMQLTNDVTELEAEKEGLELEIRSMADKASMTGPSSTSSDYTPSQYAESVATVKTGHSQVSLPISTFSGVSNLQTQPIDGYLRDIPSSGLTWVDLPQSNAHQSWPRPPLDKDLHIIIKASAVASSNMSLLKRIASITTKGTIFQIEGPAEVAKALENGMKEAQIEAEGDKAKILELQKVMWEHVQEIERLKKQECSVASHRNLSDQLTAMQAQFEMQELFLADYRRQLPGSRANRYID